MKYDFDEWIERRGSNSSKWNVKQDGIAMSIADMDFTCAPCVIDAVQSIVDVGVFGYSDILDSYYESYQYWWNKRHQVQMEKEWMIFTSGVVPALSSMIRRLSSPGEGVVVLSPVYNIFYNCILNNGRKVIESDLLYEDGVYHIDFLDLEETLKHPQTTLMILCNPHNPIGTIWRKEDLEHIAKLCLQYHVILISDEVHCDICEPGKQYTSMLSLPSAYRMNCITTLSASKAFNLAGLQAACVVCENPSIRHKIYRGIHNDEVGEPNIFACSATTAALTQGEEWLDALIKYIWANRKTAQEYIENNLSGANVVHAQATYVLWVDVSTLLPFVKEFCAYLEEEKGLYISSGQSYGTHSDGFIRINIATSITCMMEGLVRLKEGYEEFIQQYMVC